MTKKCIGCGLTLQNKDKEGLGYTPSLTNNYCMRCFRLKNYGEKDLNEEVNINEIFTKVNKGKGIVFFFVDYLNLNKYTLDLFKKVNLKKVLVVSKVDILRKDIKFNKIIKWLEKEYQILDDIIFLSTKKSYGINSIISYMDETRTKEAYIMGITNAGKSTFINHLLKSYNIKKEILVSDKPNTTLDFIPIHIDTYKIYDTPGLIYPNMNSEIIKNEIKPITFNLKKETTISFLDYELTFLNPTSVTCYFNITDIKRSYKRTLDEEISVGDNKDIVISGIGFINIKNASKVIVKNSDNIEIRNSCFGGNYE